MMVRIANWLIHAIALYSTAFIVDGMTIDTFASALIAVAVISLINVFIKPVLLLLTLPITIVSLGLFTFVLNAALLLFVSQITPGFSIESFSAALVGSIALSIITLLFGYLTE